MDREELRRRIQSRPHSVRFSELRALLEAYGWTMARIRGDHHYFVGPDGERLSVPLDRPHLKAAYVREALKLLKD
jgi:predicted RNA binding protein YcfA (HicA-like mRNA interferase family)